MIMEAAELYERLEQLDREVDLLEEQRSILQWEIEQLEKDNAHS